MLLGRYTKRLRCMKWANQCVGSQHGLGVPSRDTFASNTTRHIRLKFEPGCGMGIPRTFQCILEWVVYRYLQQSCGSIMTRTKIVSPSWTDVSVRRLAFGELLFQSYHWSDLVPRISEWYSASWFGMAWNYKSLQGADLRYMRISNSALADNSSASLADSESGWSWCLLSKTHPKDRIGCWRTSRLFIILMSYMVWLTFFFDIEELWQRPLSLTTCATVKSTFAPMAWLGNHPFIPSVWDEAYQLGGIKAGPRHSSSLIEWMPFWCQ